MKYIISRKHEFVCHLVPKVATLSLLDYFVRKPKDFYYAKHTSRKFFTFYCYHFAFIRNPYARLVSAYLNKIVYYNLEFVNQYGMYHGMLFKEFVERACVTNDEHWDDQHKYVKYCDFVGTLENMDYDFNFVCGEIGITNYGLSRLNHTGAMSVWKEFYDEYTYKMVLDRYEEDIKLYEKISRRI